jgi:hypothetical protein
MCSVLVSFFFGEVIQQIHSLRASGVISSHALRADTEEVNICRKSEGTVCTTPEESFVLMYQKNLT